MKIFYSQPLSVTLNDEKIFRANWLRICEGLDYLSNFFTNDGLDDPTTLQLRRELVKKNSLSKNPYELIYQYDDHQKLIQEATYPISPMDHLKLDMNLMASAKYVILDGKWRLQDEAKVIKAIARTEKIPVLVAVRTRYGNVGFHELK